MDRFSFTRIRDESRRDMTPLLVVTLIVTLLLSARMVGWMKRQDDVARCVSLGLDVIDCARD